MNKSELIAAIADRVGFTKADITRVVQVFEEVVIDAVKVGGELTLPGLLSISVSHRAARMGRNPRTGEPIQIKAAKVPKIKAGKKLKEAVQK